MVSVLLAEKFVTLGAVKDVLKAQTKCEWCVTMTLQSASHSRGTGTAQRWEEPFSWEQQEQIPIRAPDTSAAPAVLGAG